MLSQPPSGSHPHRGEAGIFNGSGGTITAVDAEAHQLIVTFQDGEAATYPFTDLDELVHAYALTVHRAQGSEYPYVIVPMISAAGMMLLQRNLLYTAVTRARNGAMLIGQSEAVERAIANNHTQRRNTAHSSHPSRRGRRTGTTRPHTERPTHVGLNGGEPVPRLHSGLGRQAHFPPRSPNAPTTASGSSDPPTP